MDWIMIVNYSLVTGSFVPLFIVILVKMRRYFPELFSQMKCKLIFLFTTFVWVQICRLYLYLDLKNLKFLYSTTSIYTVIPFYCSEILMALFLIYILRSVNNLESDRQSIHTVSQDNNISHIFLTNDVKSILPDHKLSNAFRF